MQKKRKRESKVRDVVGLCDGQTIHRAKENKKAVQR